MVSILLGVSMVGEKLQPLIIGKSKNPRAFKEVEIEKFDIKYEAIKTAWATREMFSKYLNVLNECNFAEKSEKNFNNFGGHKIDNLSNIRPPFLSPRATFICQPLDLGVAAPFKKYIKVLNSYMLGSLVEKEAEFKEGIRKISLLTAFGWCQDIWKELKIDSITNCWKNSIFFEIPREDDKENKNKKFIAQKDILGSNESDPKEIRKILV